MTDNASTLSCQNRYTKLLQGAYALIEDEKQGDISSLPRDEALAAYTLLKKCEEIIPDRFNNDPKLLFLMSKICFILDLRDEGLNYAIRSAQKDEKSYKFLTKYGDIHFTAWDYSGAFRIYAGAAEARPDAVAPKIRMAECLLYTNSAQNAILVLDCIKDKASEFPIIHKLLGYAYQRTNNLVGSFYACTAYNTYADANDPDFQETFDALKDRLKTTTIPTLFMSHNRDTSADTCMDLVKLVSDLGLSPAETLTKLHQNSLNIDP